MQILQSGPQTEIMPGIWQEKCSKMNHFKEVCRSYKNTSVHNMEHEDDQEQETDIEMVTFNPVNFNSNCSVIIANLKTL